MPHRLGVAVAKVEVGTLVRSREHSIPNRINKLVYKHMAAIVSLWNMLRLSRCFNFFAIKYLCNNASEWYTHCGHVIHITCRVSEIPHKQSHMHSLTIHVNPRQHPSRWPVRICSLLLIDEHCLLIYFLHRVQERLPAPQQPEGSPERVRISRSMPGGRE